MYTGVVSTSLPVAPLTESVEGVRSNRGYSMFGFVPVQTINGSRFLRGLGSPIHSASIEEVATYLRKKIATAHDRLLWC